MVTCGRVGVHTPSRQADAREGAVCAVVLTAVVAVGADIAAHAHWTHTTAVAVVAILVALGRVVAGDYDHRRFWTAISAAFLIQPVLHAASTLFPAHSVGHPWTAVAPLAVSIAIIAATVAAPATYQHFGRRAATAVSRLRSVRDRRGQDLHEPLSRVARNAPDRTAAFTARGRAVIAAAPHRGPPAAPAGI